jgi:hypothetical protein
LCKEIRLNYTLLEGYHVQFQAESRFVKETQDDSIYPLNTLFTSFQQAYNWISLADMPTTRMGHTACVVDGKIYAIGGCEEANVPGLTILEAYAPSLDFND